MENKRPTWCYGCRTINRKILTLHLKGCPEELIIFEEGECRKCWPWDCSCIDGWNFSSKKKIDLEITRELPGNLVKENEGLRCIQSL